MHYNRDMIGNATDAALALSDYESGMMDYLFADGSTRYVFLINGVLYKVNYRTAAGDYDNIEEFETINAKRASLPAGVFYPETSLHRINDRFVIAQKIVTGQPVYRCVCDMVGDVCSEYCMPEDVIELTDPFMQDQCGFNVIINDDGVHIVDCA